MGEGRGATLIINRGEVMEEKWGIDESREHNTDILTDYASGRL